MQEIVQNQASTVSIILVDASTGEALTGVVDNEITLYYLKEGATTAIQKTIDGTNFREVDDANMPGIYQIDFTASELDTVGPFIATIQEAATTNGTINQTNVRLTVVAADAASLSADLEDIKGAGFDTNTDSLSELQLLLANLEALTQRVLGLTHENFAIINPTHDASGNMTSATVRLYPSKSDTSADTNHLSEYTISASYDNFGQLASYTMVKE